MPGAGSLADCRGAAGLGVRGWRGGGELGTGGGQSGVAGENARSRAAWIYAALLLLLLLLITNISALFSRGRLALPGAFPPSAIHVHCIALLCT